MAKITNPEDFQAKWEEYISQMSKEDLSKYISETSPHHPNENMRWLYDRLLTELAIMEKRSMNPIPDLSGINLIAKLEKLRLMKRSL